jgi:alpha-glucosidase
MKQIIILFILLSVCAFRLAEKPDIPKIIQPPVALHLNPFYKKYLIVNGIHLLSSHRVPDSALYAAYRTLDGMTRALPREVLAAMTGVNLRVAVMARYEGTTDIPEHAHLAKDTTLNWDVRARGLGGDRELPLTTCAEENILCYQIDKYHAEDILVHEFAHSIHLVGLNATRPDINKQLKTALEAAKAQGKWRLTYAATNTAEYWAEGVQDWFNVNAEVNHPDGKHNFVNTRKELRRYDKGLYDILATVFPENAGSVSCHCSANKYHKE